MHGQNDIQRNSTIKPNIVLSTHSHIHMLLFAQTEATQA